MNKYIVYGKENCPFCVQAKDLLTKKGKLFEYKTLGVDYTKEELLDLVPNARTVPQIFFDGQLIGGFTELKTSV